VGSIIAHDEWRLAHSITSKVLKWGDLTNVSDVRLFLGTAGVDCKWIHGFFLIAKLLTLLMQKSTSEFFFSQEACDAQQKLKDMLSTASILIKIDYDIVLWFSANNKMPHASEEGLVVLAVNSCSHGAGWILEQIIGKDKRPVMYGSCTPSAVESFYFQPKSELYSVFHAVNDLHHQIWGIHFHLDVDAKFLLEMIRHPDLPNAPMTQWVLYLTLFDFQVNHVPASFH